MKEVIKRLLPFVTRGKILRHVGVTIHSSAKVDFGRIRLQAACILEIGEGSIVEGDLILERDRAAISIGRNTFIGNSLIASAAKVEIGDDVLISWGCNIVDHGSHAIGWEYRKEDVKGWYYGKKDWTNVPVKPVRIGNKSWIGMNVIILKGVEIGEGAVVGAGSVVTRNVQPWTVVAGNPAKLIREIPLSENR
jgi:acetyltransferase-like isoleucine patch superfamily enzyme